MTFRVERREQHDIYAGDRHLGGIDRTGHPEPTWWMWTRDQVGNYYGHGYFPAYDAAVAALLKWHQIR